MSSLHQGLVIKVDKGVAYVKMSRHSHCESCGSCPGGNAIIYELPVRQAVRPNDGVLVYIPEKNMVAAAYVLFFLPLIITFIGVMLGIWVASLLGVNQYYGGTALGSLGIIVGFTNVYFYEKRQAKNNSIYIHSIINKR